MEKILITGANGYIGSHVVSTMLDMGFDVIAVDLNRDAIDCRAQFSDINIFSDKIDLYNELGCPDRLIHLAWKDGFIHNSPAHFENLNAHYDFIKRMVDSGVKSVSVMGSMHEVGYHEGAIKASTPTNPSSMYGISKNALRQALEVLQKTSDFTMHWMRGYYIYGDDKRSNSIFAKIIQKAEAGEKQFPFTTGVNEYDFISVDELALEIAMTCVQDEVTGIINCCSGKPMSLKDAVEGFIAENKLDIELLYGVFPTRPYDSPIVYGDNTEIKKIISAAEGYNEKISLRINDLLKKMG